MDIQACEKSPVYSLESGRDIHVLHEYLYILSCNSAAINHAYMYYILILELLQLGLFMCNL